EAAQQVQRGVDTVDILQRFGAHGRSPDILGISTHQATAPIRGQRIWEECAFLCCIKDCHVIFLCYI
ncbi:MAG TPA: hypothetical protein VJM79_07000, partial [Rhizorhapis sp.]|nr:hypothetical protein [Rhizorhapis sp.]